MKNNVMEYGLFLSFSRKSKIVILFFNFAMSSCQRNSFNENYAKENPKSAIYCDSN